MISPESLPKLSFYEYLFNKTDRLLVRLYARYLVLLARRGLRRRHLHAKSFNLLYRAISHRWPPKWLLGQLQEEFICRNISLSLLLEPLDGFEWLYKHRYAITLDKLTPPLMQIISPVARLTALLNNQTPPFYQPFSALIFAYLSIYASAYPKEFNGIAVVTPQTLAEKNELLLPEASETLAVVRLSVFKLKVAFCIGMCRMLLTKGIQTTPTVKKINFLDYVNAFLYGLWYIITVRNKTRGLNQI